MVLACATGDGVFGGIANSYASDAMLPVAMVVAIVDVTVAA